MRHHSRVVTPLVVALVAVLSLPSIASKKSGYGIASYAKYVQIPGATPVGAETCTTCHSEIAKDFRHAFHAQQGIDCEACHGPGSLHVAGNGDISKIISFSHRPATDANGVCLSCHAQDAKIRNWIAGPHASNQVRCIDCHQTHNYGAKAGLKSEMSVDVMTPAHVANVENLVPETKALMQSRWQANDACLKCHETQRGQMSLPYHHPLREGKMSCADCHDPHGGPAGRNLRTANTNQLCLSCHAQYRGPYAYQHPPVTENCMTCHTAHGSPNSNLLNISEPALCLQCHAGHHNGAGLPISDRCTGCHGSIHGTDTPTPSGGSRFVDKGPSEPQLRGSSASPMAARPSPHSYATTSAIPMRPSHSPTYPLGAATGGALGMFSRGLAPMSGGNLWGGNSADTGEIGANNTAAAYSVVPGSYRFVDQTGFGGRVGEYDTLQQSAGADVATSYVSQLNHLTIVSRGNVLNSQDYQAASQVTAGDWARFGFDLRSFVQQQDHTPFYAFPLLDVSTGCGGPCDTTTDLIPSHVPFYVVRRLGKAQGQVKLPKLPVHLFVKGDWQARAGTTQFAYLDENSYVPGLGSTGQFCGAQCHYQSQFQLVNYTTRNIGGGGDIDLGPVKLTYQHKFSSFNDRLIFPTGTFTGGFDADASSCEAFAFGFAGPQCAPSSFNPPPSGPAPGPAPALPTGTGYAINIPSPNQYSSDSLSFNWTASPKLILNGNVDYTRLRDTYTNYPQNSFDSDETLIWRPLDRLRLAADYHQQNLLNNFTPYYSLYGNVSYHNHWEGLKLEYELPRNFDVEGYYKRSGITRSGAALWNDTTYNIYGSQIYSVDNTDLLKVVPSSSSNTAGLALRYHDRGLWSARTGYEWIGTHDPGYLTVPRSNNRVFANVTLTPSSWLTFANDTDIVVQNAFPAVPLPDSPPNLVSPSPSPGATGSFGLNIAGLPPTFERRNRFYIDTASATFRAEPGWNLGLGYSYQQNNLSTYMALQNDSATNYILDEPLVPYKQITQAYWGESTYTFRQRLGLNFRITYNSARSGMRPDLNANDFARLGNSYLAAQGNCDLGAPPPCFSPTMFGAALGNLNLISTQISEVIVPQWIGQSKAYYMFPRKFEGGLLFYYGSYRDYWNPDVNGVLRTFNVYVGRSW